MAQRVNSLMIVDDHQIIVDGIKMLLHGVKNISVVAEANNGRDALAILETKKVDLILMDIEMPILNGCDTTAIITSKFPNTKIIALTTHDDKSLIDKMLNAGASGYLLKNINREILLEAIEKVISGETYFSSEINIKISLAPAEMPYQVQNPLLSVLSGRETEILKHIGSGLTNNEIADKLFLSPKTVETHRTNIMRKLDIHNVVGLVKYAIKSGLVV
ncbi:MAG TPA: response regulator transcription factor [Bacteroidia bacterium]